MANETAKNRDRAGKFSHDFETVCRCGHTCGEHTAERARGWEGKMEQPCLAEDCECQVMTKAREQ